MRNAFQHRRYGRDRPCRSGYQIRLDIRRSGSRPSDTGPHVASSDRV